MTMSSFILAFVLALTPLPNLPFIPTGSEIRVISWDASAIYVVWKVDERQMVLQSKLVVSPSRDVRVLFRVNGGNQLYNGITTLKGDVELLVDGDRVSLNELLTRTYRLNLPNGRVLPEVR